MSRPADGERGAILLWVLVLTVALVALLVFVFDFGVLALYQRNLQNLADAAALAAAQELDPLQTPACDPTCQSNVQAKANAYVTRHLTYWPSDSLFDPRNPGQTAQVVPVTSSLTEPAPGSAQDVVIVGTWNFAAPRVQNSLRCAVDTNGAGAPLFTPNTGNANAVRVRVMAEDVPNFFAQMPFSAVTQALSNVCAAAVAVWSGVAQTDEVIPLAVPDCLFDVNHDGTVDPNEARQLIANQTLIRSTPANNSAWTGLGYPNANANDFRAMLQCAADPANCSPAVRANMTVAINTSGTCTNVTTPECPQLNNGNVNSAYQYLRNTAFPIIPPCPGTLSACPHVGVIVFNGPCSGAQFNQNWPVLGFATLIVTRYGPNNNPFIEGHLTWNPSLGGSIGAPCTFGSCRVGLFQ